MYIKKDQKNCEDVCFEENHINNVIKEIKKI